MSDTARPKSTGDKLSADEINRDLPIVLNAGETINGATLPVAVYVKASDGEVYACDGNDTAKLEFVGFAVTNGTDGNSITVQKNGVVSGFTGLTTGSRYYVQDDKTIGTARGTYEVFVGIAISATQILILSVKKYSPVSATRTDFQGSTSGDSDDSVTLSFRPSLIVLHYWIQGYRGGANYYSKKGIAVFSGTTMINNFVVSGGNGASDNVAVSGVYSSITYNDGAIEEGDLASNNGSKITVTINSVSDTGFVIRRTIALQTSGDATWCRFKCSYIAYP